MGTKLIFSIVCHPQTNGQTKVMSRTLAQILRCFIGKNWLPHIEFSYDCVVNSTTAHTPFELIYDLHAKVKSHIPNVFNEGDLVWLHLRKEKFPRLRKSKLLPHELSSSLGQGEFDKDLGSLQEDTQEDILPHHPNTPRLEGSYKRTLSPILIISNEHAHQSSPHEEISFTRCLFTQGFTFATYRFLMHTLKTMATELNKT
ncbi:hypothetical protein CR513_12322, partial [Mucuna pruriens]